MSPGYMTDRPVRAGVYGSIDAATDAVHSLRAAGFTSDQISVVSSEEHAQRHFGALTEEPAGAHVSRSVGGGAAAGLGLGGAAVAGVLLAGGTPVVALGALGGLALTGTLIGLFASRGAEKEAADFYDQSLQAGDLLVVVEIHGDDAERQLARAEEIFRETGAKPLALPAG